VFKHITNRDLEQLFLNSVIRYDGIPVLVVEILDVNNSYIKPLGEEVLQNPISFLDKKIDLTPVPLGMLNYKDCAYWVRRGPVRAWKQGLHDQNIAISFIDGPATRSTLNDIRSLDCKGLSDCILGNYPSLQNILDTFKPEKLMSKAFNRVFAVTNQHKLYHKTALVGCINPDNGNPLFRKGYDYLHKIWE
jgi:hypothetical protein